MAGLRALRRSCGILRLRPIGCHAEEKNRGHLAAVLRNSGGLRRDRSSHHRRGGNLPGFRPLQRLLRSSDRMQGVQGGLPGRPPHQAHHRGSGCSFQRRDLQGHPGERSGLPGVRRRALRGLRVQSHVQDHDRAREQDPGLPAPGDRPGHVHKLPPAPAVLPRLVCPLPPSR